MDAWFASGRIVDVVIGVMVLEFVALALVHALRGRGPGPRDLAAGLAPGVCLLVALRLALTGAGWPAIATALLAALAAHLLDLAGRWPRKPH